MKQKYNLAIIIIMLIFVANTFAQNEIPNAGFEDWSGLDPDLWTSTNSQNLVTNVTKTDDAHSGSWAAKGEVVEFFGVPYPPGLFAGKQTGICCLPFPITQNYEKFTGYYKCNVGGQDLGLGIIVTLNDVNFQTVAVGIWGPGVSNSFEQFSVLMDYSLGNGNDAAFGTIEFALGSDSADSVSYDSWWIVDDLAFEGVVSNIDLIENTTPKEFSLEQNYPNPFNPLTNIKFSLPEKSFVTLKVFNIQGEKVATLVNEQLSSGSYSIDWNSENNPSGTYIYSLTSNNFVEAKKMILLK